MSVEQVGRDAKTHALPLTRWLGRVGMVKPWLPAVFFLSGVTYDTLTLTRIDRFTDNLILLFYLLLLGGLIIAQARTEAGLKVPLGTRAQPYYAAAIQFLFGGLFSAYAVFYSQSASFSATALYFGVLVLFLVGNEFLRTRLSNLRLLVALYVLVLFNFLTFFLPVLTGIMSTALFLLGAAVSALAGWRIVLWAGAGADSTSRLAHAGPAGAVLVALIVAYVFNIIPPVPLSLKYGGVFHNVGRSQGHFELAGESPPWYRPWERWAARFHGEGPIYCFTAVFAPAGLRTVTYHHWQHRYRRGAAFATTDRIAMTVGGGRDEGYRGYTVKQRIEPGDWRVDVETEDGRVIGRILFQVVPEEPGSAPANTRVIVY